MGNFVTQAGSYAEIYERFRWRLPATFNIAAAVCDRHAAANPSGLALIHDDGGKVAHYSFADIQRLANRLANALVALGLAQGDRVLLQLPQHPVTAFAHVACWKAGLVSVPTSVLFGVDGLEYRLQDSAARVLITDQANLDKALAVRARAPALRQIIVTDAAGLDGVINLDDLMAPASTDFTTLQLAPDTPAFINYTSGTTGWPKGTLQAHRSMLGHMPGAEILYDFFPQEGDLLWSPADWAWLAGLMDVLMPAWFHGKPVLSFSMAKFDPELALVKMGRHGVRNTLLTPTVLKLMRPVRHLVARENVRLRSIVSGSEAVGRELLEEMNAIFGATINEGFGQTECNLVLGNCSRLNHARIGSLGAALPGHVAAIVDDDGQVMPAGAVGNLAFRRPDPVMLLEYINKPEATAEKFIGDWLITGDLASCDEAGFYWFFGRADDVITSAGYRIGPGEIEDALIGHPAVGMAAVIGVPDAARTESIRAYVVLADGYEASEALAEALKASVRERLAKHERPHDIVFVPALPLTTTGKVLRRELRERARAEHAAASAARRNNSGEQCMTPIERRLVVTGHDARGQGIVASDANTAGKPVPGMEGYQIADIWGADRRVTFPDRGARPAYTDFFPPKDGFRFMEVLVPAKSVVEHDTSLHGHAAADMQESMPGLADTMAQGRPGMHRTATVDMIYIIEGACVLALDTTEIVLKAGDTAIQCGTMHAWTNPFDQPCRFIAVLIGANNDAA